MADVELFPTQMLSNEWFCQDKDILGVPSSDGFEFLKELSPEQLLSNDPLDTTLLTQFSDTSSLTSSPMGGFGFEMPVSPHSDAFSSSGTDSCSDEDYSANGSQEEFTDFSSLMSSFQPVPQTPSVTSPEMAESPAKKQKKKRKVQQSPESVQFYNTSGKFVELCEEDLIKLDSQKMECYIQAIHNERSLTAAEDKELKRIRRLIKNREYAQSSRNKKKQHVEDMQSQINAVKDENDKLQSRIQQLELENKNLKFQLGKIVQAVSADPDVFSKLKVDTTGLNLPSSQPAAPSQNKRKRNATMFVILFSFSLLLSPSFLPSFSGNVWTGNHVASFSTARTLLTSQSSTEMPLWTKAVAFLPDEFQDWLHRNYLNQLETDTCLSQLDFSSPSTDNLSVVKEEPVKQEPCDDSLGCVDRQTLHGYTAEVNSTGL